MRASVLVEPLLLLPDELLDAIYSIFACVYLPSLFLVLLFRFRKSFLRESQLIRQMNLIKCHLVTLLFQLLLMFSLYFFDLFLEVDQLFCGLSVCLSLELGQLSFVLVSQVHTLRIQFVYLLNFLLFQVAVRLELCHLRL